MIRSTHGCLPVGMRWFIPVSVVCLANWSQPIAIAQLPAISSTQASDTTTTTVIHVNPVSGNDTTADGSDRAPFKTITRALDAAVPNTTIQLAPGTYSTNTGEIFPIALKPRVTLQGNPETRGQEVIIRGGGAFSSPNLPQQNVAILGGANQSSLLGVTVTNPDGYAIQIESSHPTIANNTLINNSRGGIVLTGSSASLIRNNFFYQNGTSSIRILGNAQPQIRENIIEQSDVGIVIGGTASPLIVGNRVTQNKTGITVQGQAQPKLRGNSVESNEQFGLAAIAQAQPDLGSPTDSDANFFRNNGKQDIALQTQASNEPTKPESKPNQETKQPQASKNPTPIPVEKPEVALPASKNSGTIVVPTITVPIKQSVSAPAKPTLPSSQPTSQSVPQAEIAPASGATAQAFPKPSALSTPSAPRQASRPIQVIQLESPGRNAPVPDTATPTAEAPLATIQISSEPKAKPSIQSTTTNSSQSRTTSTATPNGPVRLPLPVRQTLMDEIPAPPTFAPRPPAVSQPTLPVPAPRDLSQTSTNGFPVPAAVQPAPIRPAVMLKPKPVQMAPVQTPIVPPSASIATPRSIVIPVPPPENDQLQLVPVRTPKPAKSPLSLAPLATTDARSMKSGNLLPVPGPNIPVGNVGDMPSVYSARGNRPIPGMPINPATAGSVVVKYRVVVVAVDDTQQEQVRSMIPDAFPVVYRGQRVLQAGAFGDRTKADQLVASLNTQGIQAIIEPLE